MKSFNMISALGQSITAIVVGSILFAETATYAQAPTPGAPRVAAQQPNARQPFPGQPTVAPHAPFHLNQQQRDYLNQVLVAWEQHTTTIKTFKTTFHRWSYDQQDREVNKSQGELSYKAPDQGTFRVDKVFQKNQQGEYVEIKDSIRDHWTTDGKVVRLYEGWQNPPVVREKVIPPQLRGQSIRNSPIPFLFGSKPSDLQERYWLRVVTPQQFAQAEIWLEAYPRYQADAANFSKSIIRFDRTNFHPVALRRYMPTGEYDSYKFENISVNPLLPNWKELFSPAIPRGWKLVRENPAPVAAAQPDRQQPAQR